MERFRQILAGIATPLGQLTASQRLLIASLAVIGAMSLFLVAQYSGRADMVDLMADDPSTQIVQTLNAAGVDAQVVDGRVMVASQQRARAVASLGESGQLPNDTTLLFNNLLERQDWRHNRQQSQQQFLFALQNELSRVISQFRGIRSATVMLDVPQSRGLGAAQQRATASVSIFTETGRPIAQDTVDAIARMVAGSQSGLVPSSVEVIDGTTGRPRRATDDSSFAAGDYIEHAQLVEKLTKAKLESLLAYIPGVMVSVTAQVDVTRVQTSSRKNLPINQGTVSVPLRTSESSTIQSRSTSPVAAPGVRANQSASISSGTISGPDLERTDDETDFEVAIGSETKSIVDPRGMPTYLAASVNVPQGWVEQLIRASSPAEDGDDDASPPPISDDELQQRFASIRPGIVENLLPHLTGIGPGGVRVDGEVSVQMVPVAWSGSFSVAPAEAGMLGGIGSLMQARGGGGDLVNTLVIGVLAVISLGMMLMLVKRSGKRVELPTPAELVGIPQRLDTASELFGEADVGNDALVGIEVTAEEVEGAQILDQVHEMVRTEPDAAAKMLRRWIEANG